MKPLSSENKAALVRLVETLQLKGYSVNTIRTYRNEFIQLLSMLGPINVNDLSTEHLRRYMLYCINELKLSEATLHSRLNAIKFYFENVLSREKIFVEIPRPKKPSNLPKFLSVIEVRQLLEVTTNLKHNTLLKMCYGMGLRVSEVVAIRLCDIDFHSMQVFIRRAKGKQDRYCNLPACMVDQIYQYEAQYKPKVYLFEGQNGGLYTVRSAQAVFHNALLRARIKKSVGIHALRHSFATHLLDTGTQISFIQHLLGHKKIETTLIYTRVTNRHLKNVRSPLDAL